MSTEPQPKLRTNVPSANVSDVGALQTFVNKRIGAEFLDMEKHVAYACGVLLDQLVFRRVPEGWMVIIKGSRKGRAVAGYLNADTYAEAVEFAGEFAARGIIDWVDDKWPSKRLKESGTLRNS